MSEKKTSSFAVKLLKPHTHAGQAYAKGAVIAASKLSQVVADWLVQNGIGEKTGAAADPAPAAPNKSTKE